MPKIDIAVVELEKPFDFNEQTKIFPACLYGKDGYGSDLLYAGYGSTYVRFENSSGENLILPERESFFQITESILGNKHLRMTKLKTAYDWLIRLKFSLIEASSEYSSVCTGDSGMSLRT